MSEKHLKIFTGVREKRGYEAFILAYIDVVNVRPSIK